jgi:hypothetical protein
MPGRLTKDEMRNRNGKIAAGIAEVLGNAPSVTLDGKTYTPAALRALFDADTAAMDRTDTATAARQKAVAEERRAHAVTHKVTLALKQFLYVSFGEKNHVMLGKFGFAPPKAKEMKTVKTKATAVEKRNATREARGTMGPKQRKKIKGKARAKEGA